MTPEFKNMKWIVRWTDILCDEREMIYNDVGEAITFIQAFPEEIERIRLFLNEDHVATYYTPKKGYWT